MLQTCGRRWQQSAKGQTFSARTSRYAAVFAKCRSAKNPAGGTSVWTCATNGNRGHQNSILRICDGQNDYSASGQDRFSGDGCRCGATGSRLNAPLAAAEILGKLCTHAADNEKNQISGSYYAQQARDNKHGSFFEGCGFPAPPAAWEPVGRVTFLRNGIPQSDFSGNGQPVHPKPIVFPRFHCDLGQICCTPRNPRRRRAERGARSAPRAAPVQRKSEFGLAWGESGGTAPRGARRAERAARGAGVGYYPARM